VTRKTFVGVRLSGDGLTYVDEKGTAVGLNRSEMIRMMLDYAAENMPDTYLWREAGRTGRPPKTTTTNGDQT
jgi:DsbC/DsbD-like thiol-disulfide interchange protein